MEEDVGKELTTIQRVSVNYDMLKRVSKMPSDKKKGVDIVSYSNNPEEIADILRYYRLFNSYK